MKRRHHRILVRNATEYPDAEVKKIVLDTLRGFDCENVEVVVNHRPSPIDDQATGNYREWWVPRNGENRPVIRISLPRPGIPIHDYEPYTRSREQGKSFPLPTWQDALVAVAAHEGMHHKQTPRNGYGTMKKRGRFVEVEADLAAYRAVARRAK